MEALIHGITTITLGQIAMMLIGALLMYLGIKKEYEPTLLVPMGLGAILVNFPGTGVLTQVVGGTKAEGVLDVLFKAGINTELFPLLIFIGIGAMIDFGPLLQNPFMLLSERRHSLVFSLPFLLQYSSASTLKRLLQSGSSGLPMVRHPFLFQTSWRRICWGPSQWRLIRTWHWCRLFNPWPSKQSQPSMNAAFG